MNSNESESNVHPAPQHSELSRGEGFFALFGGPLAWFIQLCAGFALASQPCFSGGMRLLAPPLNAQWTWAAMVTVVAAGVCIALAAAVVSWRVFQRTNRETGGDHRHLSPTGSRRTRFLALWGTILGIGFALATLLTAVAFFTMSRCAA